MGGKLFIVKKTTVEFIEVILSFIILTICKKKGELKLWIKEREKKENMAYYTSYERVYKRDSHI